MKLNLSLPLSRPHLPASPRRWWLGWVQLLCAWLLCMLLCANVALALAQEREADAPQRPAARKPVACAASAVAAAGLADMPPPTLRETLRCSGA